MAGCEPADSGKVVLPPTPTTSPLPTKVLPPTESKGSGDATVTTPPQPSIDATRTVPAPTAFVPPELNLTDIIAVRDSPGTVSGAVTDIRENIIVNDILDVLVHPVQTVQPQPLPPPKLLSPGSTSSPGPVINTLTPSLQWSNVSGADNYGIYVFDINSGSIVFDSQSKGIPVKGTMYTLPSGTLQSGRNYNWYMKSHNAAGWGDISAPMYFLTQQKQQ